MLPAATERILATVPDDASVLLVGGWSAPLRRADWVLEHMPYETRGGAGGHGPPPERFTARTWVQRDVCARAPWPFRDGQFDFAVCVQLLEGVRDPVWVCSELSRVANAGYVEVPTLEAELVFGVEGGGPWLGHASHRWLVAMRGGQLVFTHKPHSIHADWTLRVLPRWVQRMTIEDHLQGLFWEGSLPARERLLAGVEEREAAMDELRERLRARFEPSDAELRVKQAREAARHGVNLAKRPVRAAAGRALDRFGRR